MRLRKSGILLHVTSLPGALGIGDLGPAAYEFVDFLARCRQAIWQVLPLGPTGYGDSPYQSFSAFGGNPLLISPERLFDEGLLSADELDAAPAFPTDRVEFETVPAWRTGLLHKAFQRFTATTTPGFNEAFEKFCRTEAAWLDDFALFMAIKERQPAGDWTSWDAELCRRQPEALQLVQRELAEAMRFHRFTQFLFRRQWSELRKYANERGVLILGDVPIFVAHDSADVWANQSLFQLDEAGRATAVAGVPPDYFCATGQRWGNPLYRWDRMAATGYAWWTARMAAALATVDLVRLDHFRGFEANWEIPADRETAIAGRWATGPGLALFHAMSERLGPLQVIAEDLGVITPQVERLRDDLGYPGMRILQFAFGEDPKAVDYQPHSYVRNCVTYTGTHDNDTAVGWFRSQAGEGTTRTAEQIDAERDFALRYLHTGGTEIHWDLIRAAWSSVADTALAPMQDLLGLGSEARMNRPGSESGNWRWRLAPDAITADIERRLREMSEVYGR